VYNDHVSNIIFELTLKDLSAVVYLNLNFEFIGCCGD